MNFYYLIETCPGTRQLWSVRGQSGGGWGPSAFWGRSPRHRRRTSPLGPSSQSWLRGDQGQTPRPRWPRTWWRGWAPPTSSSQWSSPWRWPSPAQTRLTSTLPSLDKLIFPFREVTPVSIISQSKENQKGKKNPLRWMLKLDLFEYSQDFYFNYWECKNLQSWSVHERRKIKWWNHCQIVNPISIRIYIYIYYTLYTTHTNNKTALYTDH